FSRDWSSDVCSSDLDLRTDPVHTEEAGSALWRFAQNSNSDLWSTPGLFDNFGIKTKYGIKTTSLAAYTQLDWAITDKLHILPGQIGRASCRERVDST